jgi:uncharacterized protein YlbG (UPF0298 family)
MPEIFPEGMGAFTGRIIYVGTRNVKKVVESIKDNFCVSHINKTVFKNLSKLARTSSPNRAANHWPKSSLNSA